MRSSSAISWLVGAALGLAAVLPAQAQATKISIGYVGATDFLAAFVAKDMGFFEKRNLDATLTRVPIATNIPAALVSNSLQIGMTTPPILLQAAEGGLDLVLVAGATRMLRENPTLSLMARKEVKIAKAEDLKGKKVGVPGFNSVGDIMFRKWLIMNGVKPSEVTIVEAGIPQMADLLKGGTLDAVTAVEPIRSRIASTDVGYNAAEYFTAVNPDVLLTAWMSTGDWAKKNAPVVKSFREAIDEGLAYIRANPEAAKEIEKKYISFNTPRFPTFVHSLKASDLKIYVDIGKELGLYRTDIAVDKLVVN